MCLCVQAKEKKKCRSYPKRLISGSRHKDMSSASVWWTWIQATSPDEVLQKATYSGKANSLILASVSEIFFFLTQNFISLQSSFRRWDPHYRICKNFRIFSIGSTLLHYTTKCLFIRVAERSLRINNLCLFGVYYTGRCFMNDKLILSCMPLPNEGLNFLSRKVL